MPGQSTVAPRVRIAGLFDRLEATRTGLRAFQRTRGLLWTAVAVLALLGLLAAADWLLVLTTSQRGTGLLLIASVAVVLPVYWLIAAGRTFGRRDTAAEVEAAFPHLGQRVRTTVEYAEPDADPMPAAPGLVEALAADTDRRTRILDFRGLIPWRSLCWVGTALLGLAALFVTLLAVSSEARIALQRLFLAPAGYTRLEVKPGDESLKIGGDFTIQAILSGRPVHAVELQHRPAGSGEGWTTIPFAPDDGKPAKSRKLLGALDTTLKDCRDDLEYRVVAGPVESPVYQLTIRRPLVLKGIEAHVEPPAYTRRPATVSTDGNFKVIAGSRVRFRITLDRGPQTAQLLTAVGALPLEIHGNELTGELPAVEKELEYQLSAEAADGMRLEDAARYRITVQPDRKPTVRFLKPQGQIEVTPTTEVHMKVEAGDDFGLAAVGIVYQVGSGPWQTLLLRRDAEQPTSLKVEAVLALEDLDVSFRDGITYYAFAEDNHPNPPQRTTTELQFIDIRPYKREYQLVEGGGCCKGSSITLEELISRQRENLSRTFVQSEMSKPDGAALKRLARNERELAKATQEFTDGIEQAAGQIVPPLHDAQEAMEAATAALDGADLKSANGQEETALAALIRARENVRQLLSENSKCASACRKFDNQQQQKLRKPPPKEKKEEQAQLPEEIAKLAQEEKKFSEEMAAKNGGAKPSESQGSPAERQEKAAAKAAELQKRVREDEALTDLARERMDAAADAVQASAQAAKGGREREAGEQAGEAAEQLERLARQVAGLKAPDLTTRLGQNEGLARQLARKQQGLGKELQDKKGRGGADEERRLTEEARTLDDLLKRLQEDAAGKNPDLARQLREAGEANPPEKAVEQMRRAADALKEGKGEQARPDVEESARLLDGLGQQLEAARRGLVQPQLDRLMALEKQAAEAQKAVETANGERDKAEAEKKVGDLREALENLQPADPKLTEAAAKLRHGTGDWQRREEPHDPHVGAYVPPREYAEGVPKVVKELQAKIQEIILKDALLDKDEGVPPQYKALVEEYYRLLSDDIR